MLNSFLVREDGMESEDIVTRILTKREILKKKRFGLFSTNPNYNLGEFLQKAPSEPNPYDSRFVFIK